MENKTALTFAPNFPKAFKASSSFTVKIDGSNSLYEYKDKKEIKLNNNRKIEKINLKKVTLKFILFNFASILFVLLFD